MAAGGENIKQAMISVENIYLSKLSQFEGLLEEKGAKLGGASSAFADIFSTVQQRMDAYAGFSSATVQATSSTDNVYEADVYTGYTGSTAATASEIDAAVEKAACGTGLDPDLIRAVIQTESSFRSNAVSSCGAQGLMQLMPGTARELGVTDAFDPEQNVMGGSTYLVKQLQRFGDVRLALAAYNTGPGQVASYGITDADDSGQFSQLSERVRGYVNKVLKYYEQFKNE